MNLLPTLTSAFSELGFALVQNEETRSTTLGYRGIVSTQKHGPVTIEFRFRDSSLTEFPTAHIISTHETLAPYHTPHLDGKSELCFHDGAEYFDRYNLRGMVKFFIARVNSQLEESKNDDMVEISTEFPSYWVGEANYFGDLTVAAKECFVITKDARKLATENGKIWGISIQTGTRPAKIFTLASLPTISGIHWPITNTNDLYSWLAPVPSIASSLKAYVLAEIRECRRSIPVVFYCSDLQVYFGLHIIIQDAYLTAKKGRQHIRESPARTIANKPHAIQRFTISNYTEESIIQGSNPDVATLSNKKILLIGAGTLGSNLANLLVRTGAGCGKGELRISDIDVFQPYNMPRHFLGLPSSGKAKAAALAEKLKEILPTVKVAADISGVQSIYLWNFDLIINATGDQAVSQWLNDRFLNERLKRENLPTIIQTWILGKGQAAQCLIQEPKKNLACYECLTGHPEVSKMEPVIDEDRFVRRDSCMAVYTPFPLSASLSTSIMAAYAIEQWLVEKNSGWNFISQNLHPTDKLNFLQVAQRPDCPACGQNYTTE